MAMLKEGDKAPDFCLEGIDEEGKEVKVCLKDLLGQNLIIYFYPKDNTPGCTQEACDFRDNIQALISKGYRVLGISPDPISSHKKFQEKYQLNFPLVPCLIQPIRIFLPSTWHPSSLPTLPFFFISTPG